MIANNLFITGSWKTTWTWIKETGGSSTDERKSGTKVVLMYSRKLSKAGTYAPEVVLKKAEKATGEKGKSRVKVLTQTIIGMYLCPGSRAK